jgi:hypothetical protein
LRKLALRIVCSPFAGEVAVKRGFGNAGLDGDLAEGVAMGSEQAGVFDLLVGVRDGSADVPAGSLSGLEP